MLPRLNLIATATGIAAVGLSFALCAPVSSSTTPPRAQSVRTSGIASGTARRAYRLRSSVDTTSCTSDSSASPAPQYFVGISGPSVSNYAGGLDAAVLGGINNEACDRFSGIGEGTYNTIGTSDGNTAAASFIAAGTDNGIISPGSFIGAGGTKGGFAGSFGNYISGSDSFIGTGDENEVEGNQSMVGAGYRNVAAGNGSFIGAGGSIADSMTQYADENRIGGNDSFIGSGDMNNIDANEAFVGGGNQNDIEDAATYASIVGGNNNRITGAYGAIGGGSGNETTGAFAVIPGGADNEALGAASFAAGYHAKAAHNGSFVWSDDVSGSGYATDGNTNEFVVRSSGGTYFFSNEGESVGVKLAAGSGAWASTSDRNEKTDVVPLDDDSILAKVAGLPIDAWRYKTERGVRHLGPMAQDFYAAFNVGEDNRHITSIDEDGVALAAIKALHRENERLERKNDALQTDLARVRADALTKASRIDALDRDVRSLNDAVGRLLRKQR